MSSVDSLFEQLRTLIRKRLDEAEKHWEIGGKRLAEAEMISISAEQAGYNYETHKSYLPGYKFVNDSETVIEDYIAFVADMRKSSDHLNTNINAKVSNLQRVYYETSALLPAIALVVDWHGGGVTEYLGDGLLAFFRVDKENKWPSIEKAYNASVATLEEVRNIINTELKERYRLPPLNLGVGLSMSPMLVTLIGLDGQKQPKAIGRCVYKATKLSCEINKVVIDDCLMANWEKSNHGRFFKPWGKKDIHNALAGYIAYSVAS